MNGKSKFWLRLISLLPDGPWSWDVKASQLESEGSYKDGKREGPHVGYTKDGTVIGKETGTFKDGVKISD